MIAFSCSNCGMKFQLKDEFAGRTTRCPTCKLALIVPPPAADKIASAPALVGKEANDSNHQIQAAGAVPLALKHKGARDVADPRPVSEVLIQHADKGERYIVECEIARGGM